MVDKSNDRRNWEAYTARACKAGECDAAMTYTWSAAIGQNDAKVAYISDVSEAEA